MPILVGLGPHGIAAVAAPDETFEEILPLWSGMQSLRATGVLLQSDLDGLEKTVRDKRLVSPGEKLVMVFDLAGVEAVMQDASD
jgi:hypothetical protein